MGDKEKAAEKPEGEKAEAPKEAKPEEKKPEAPKGKTEAPKGEKKAEVKTGSMDYVYAAMLLHAAKQKVDEKNVAKVLEAAGVRKDDARVKALVASLEGVDIDEAISKAAQPVAVAAAPAASGGAAAEKTEEKKEEDESKKDEQAAAGLGSLFG